MKNQEQSNVFDFPFIGAGDASYFEWAGIYVVFENEPNKEQKKEIEKTVPVPVNELSWEENAVYAGSGQFAHVDIASNYETKDGSDPENPDNWEDDRWFFASDSQVSMFNKDIERWLNEIHEISPIMLAFRAEDFESGGTEFSEWHDRSMKQLHLILPFFDETVEKNIHDSLKSEVLKNILWIMKEDSELEDKYTEFLYPGKKEVEAFLNGDIFPLKNAALKGTEFLNLATEFLIQEIDIDQKKHRQLITEYSEELIAFKDNISEYEFEQLCIIIWNAAYKENNPGMMKKIPKSQELVNIIAHEAYQKILAGEFEESILLYDDIISCKTNDLSLYCNALYVLQNDNTGLPVNPELNNKFIKASLPYACQNPAVFYNIACLHNEMKEYDKAYDMVKMALDHKYDGYESMKAEIINEGIFKRFREKTDVLNLLESFK